MDTEIDQPRPALPPDRLWQPTTASWFAAVFGFALVYAVVRYHVAAEVPWRHLPLFILDKATALAAVMFVASSYLVGKIFRWHDGDKALRLVVIKFCGLMGFFLAAVHAFFALCLLDPAYLPKYFDVAGRLNVQGELAMAAGVVALFFLLSPAITTMPKMAKELGAWRWKRSQRIGYVALLLTAVHLVALGLEGWLTPARWPAAMPPISLVALVAAALPLLVKRRLVRVRAVRRHASA